MSLTEQIGDLHAALDIAKKKMPGIIGQSEDVLDKSIKRRSIGADLTVVALAGATGSGKSSLLNALVGQEISPSSAIRPTTLEPIAVSNTNANDLLDWLDINDRHEAELTNNGGLVLIDLPDIDSTQFVHRDTAKRLTALVDVVVWVLDPQKYADAVLHEDYLSNLAEHASTTIVVLNQADRLDDPTLTAVIDDAGRLLADDGLQVDVIPTSALTGRGLVKLWDHIELIVKAKTAADERLAADMRTCGRNMIGAIHADGGQHPRTAQKLNFEPVAQALAAAGGADVVAKASAASYRKRAREATGWPVTRWLAERKIDPLKRLRLVGNTEAVTGARGFVSPALATAADTQARRFVDAATSHLPRLWAKDVKDEMGEGVDNYLARIDEVISETNLEATRRPLWWIVVNLLQWLALIVAIVGGAWLFLLIFADTLQLQLGEPPAWGIFPTPIIMLISGLLSGWLLALLGHTLASSGERHTRERVRRRLRGAIEEDARAELLVTLETERQTYEHLYTLLGSLTRASR
ncbi:GTP-binding protein EngB required for normal cell division [Trueperella bonasi]|uniref:GTP-binding protein EngB required for normal cell division n=1 Tax=Trueperella bonasi TaxID=312286 RepID=A0ABT9NDZ7_9ACTO|nr:dynamin family protein [Trueperella bonasi]MDP9805422.1 GTP-binding protein EngB required for normal cell division [Trueperella bonasi]